MKLLRRYVCLSCALILGATAPYSASAKHLSFQMPTQQKLTTGSSPKTAPEPTVRPAASLDLSPVGLSDDQPSENAGAESEANGYLKSTVTETKFLSKDQAGTASKNAITSGNSVSVVNKKDLGEKVLKDGAKKVEVAPLALMETDSESEKKAEVSGDAEKHQLSDLWNSTMGRNPDIQFVINKLQPSEDANHAMASTMKVLSTVLFGAMNVAPMAVGMNAGGTINPMTMMGVSSGTSLIQGLFTSKAEKEAKKHAISQEQATMLYKIVRDTADKLVGSYRDYKKDITSLSRASNDLQDLQSMVSEVRGTQDTAKQVEMEYTLRKARRDIDKEAEEARRRRMELVDLAGDEAVAKLDQEMQEEREALAKLTGSPEGGPSDQSIFVNPLASTESPKKTAGGPAVQIH